MSKGPEVGRTSCLKYSKQTSVAGCSRESEQESEGPEIRKKESKLWMSFLGL